jgi:hypothetical protein
MDEDILAQLHDDLVNSKSRRGKFGGIGAGQKRSVLLDGPSVDKSALAKVPDRPLYKRFVPALKRELCRETVIATLKANGGKLRWNVLVSLAAEECGEVVTRDFKYRVLTNIPASCLSASSPFVEYRI